MTSLGRERHWAAACGHVQAQVARGRPLGEEQGPADLLGAQCGGAAPDLPHPNAPGRQNPRSAGANHYHLLP